MKNLFYLRALSLMLIVSSAAASCVDRDYVVKDVNLEVAVAQNGLKIPIAEFEKKTLANLLGEETLDGHLISEDGYYKLTYTPTESISHNLGSIGVPDIGDQIGGVLGSVPAIGLDDIPDFSSFGSDNIQLPPLNLPLAVPSAVTIPSGYLPVGGGRINAYVSTNAATIGISGVTGLPTQLTQINTVWLGGSGADAEKGSLVTITFNFGGLADVIDNAGFDIDIDLALPERYTVGEAEGYPNAGTLPHEFHFTKHYAYADRNNDVVVKFYIEKIDFSNIPISDGETVPVNEPLSCSVGWSFTTQAGTVGGTAPHATVTGAPQFRDAKVVVEGISLGSDLSQNIALTPITIDDIPEDVTGLKLVRADFENGEMTFGLNSFNLPFAASPTPSLQIKFPLEFVIEPENAGHLGAGNVLTIPLSELQAPNNYGLTLERLDWGTGTSISENIPMVLEDIEVAFLGELKTTLKWSEDIQTIDVPDELVITINTQPDFRLEDIAAKFSAQIQKDIEAIDMSQFTDKLEGLDAVVDLIPPTLRLDVTSPAGITVAGKVVIDPQDADGNTLAGVQPVEVPITVGPAAATKLFIVDTGYTGVTPNGYTRVQTNLASILHKIPSKLAISFSAGSDTDTVQAIPLTGDIAFSIDYAAEMPLGFGPEMNITYNYTYEKEGLGDLFKELADYKVKANDISVSVGLEASFPLKIGDATDEAKSIIIQLLDADGETIPGLSTYVKGVIEGPLPGGEPGSATNGSTLTIGLKVPNGDFTTLTNIDMMKIQLPIRPTGTNTGDENLIGPEDYVSGKAWLSLPEGIGVDLGEILK